MIFKMKFKIFMMDIEETVEFTTVN